jgi:L-threonylcarbamoyladenylate synthase
MDHSVTAADIDAAVAALRRGECIGLPTETVYGLAADARNAEAVQRIFALKGRPADHPLIVHLHDLTALDDFARDIPPQARLLAHRFWPGPLTLILKRQPGIPDAVTGGQDTIGLRAPAHRVAQQVLTAFGGGLAAPSANRFGHISPTRASHVRDEFGDALPIVLDGGDCALGIESTIVDFSGGKPRILRPGSISAAQIEAVVGPLSTAGADAPRVAGSLDKHYAPRTPMRLCSRAALAEAGTGAQLLALDALPQGRDGIALPAAPQAYAHGLYAALRALDARGAPEIVVERPPDTIDWLAVQDRLRRSAAGAGDGA